jgi:hypothetical protein
MSAIALTMTSASFSTVVNAAAFAVEHADFGGVTGILVGDFVALFCTCPPSF